MSTRDADFTPKSKELIAKRAGYRCSYPGCDESTIGPGAGPDDVENKGVAAHIYAASKGPRAPRGTGGLSPDERSSSSNGIWMCKDHSDIIDIEKGKNYPAAVLQSWKALHEMRIAREVNKAPIGQGHWLEKITLETNPLFPKGSSLILGKVTLIIGRNGSGKSALCEWISGCSGNGDDLDRWGKASDDIQIWIRMGLIVPERVEFSMKFKNYSMFSEYQGKKTLDIAHCTRVHYQKGKWLVREEHEDDDLEYLARVWRIEKLQVEQVIEHITSSKYGCIEMAKFRPRKYDEDDEEDDEPHRVVKPRRGRGPQVLWIQFSGRQFDISFEGLSESEQEQVIISGAIVIADLTSQNSGALLLLDFGGMLDDNTLSEYAERLQSGDFNFQTILVAANERPKVNWTGWSIVRLVGEQPDVKIKQDSIGHEDSQ